MISVLTPYPSQEQIARFRNAVEDLVAVDRLGIAVSGGPDSLALLLLGAAAYPGRIQAATVDHGLRAESAQEARHVADICARIGVPHSIITTRVDTSRASLQQSARQARYAALDQWLADQSLSVLATAHHADDQAETMLMRMLRGAGVGGLAGVRAKTRLPHAGSNGYVIRPLIGWRRQELRDLIDTANIEPVDDPSNHDQRHDRVRIRKLLAGSDWIDPVPLATSAAALAQADDALDWSARRVYGQRVCSVGKTLHFVPEEIPAELTRRIVLAIFAVLQPEAPAPRGPELSRLIRALKSGESATLGGVKARHDLSAGDGIRWIFEQAPARRRNQ